MNTNVTGGAKKAIASLGREKIESFHIYAKFNVQIVGIDIRVNSRHDFN